MKKQSFKEKRLDILLKKNKFISKDITYLLNNLDLLEGTIYSNLKNPELIYDFIHDSNYNSLNKIISASEVKTLNNETDLLKIAKILYLKTYYNSCDLDFKSMIHDMKNHFYFNMSLCLSIYNYRDQINPDVYTEAQQVVSFLYLTLDKISIHDHNNVIDGISDNPFNLIDLLMFIHYGKFSFELNHALLETKLKEYLKNGYLFAVIANFEKCDHLINDQLKSKISIAKQLSLNQTSFYEVLKSMSDSKNIEINNIYIENLSN